MMVGLTNMMVAPNKYDGGFLASHKDDGGLKKEQRCLFGPNLNVMVVL